jgi:hypothetical protein
MQCNGIARRQFWLACTVMLLGTSPTTVLPLQAGEIDLSQAVAGDPPHQGPYPDIPCRCRFNGKDFGLGQTVCMHTYLGTQFARCELFINNTTWTPTGRPCEVSDFGRGQPSSESVDRPKG